MPALDLGTIDRITAASQTISAPDCGAFSSVRLTLTDGRGDLEVNLYLDAELGSDLADAINGVFARHASAHLRRAA